MGVIYAVNVLDFSYNAIAQCFPVGGRDWIVDPCRQHGDWFRKGEKKAGTANEPSKAVGSYRTGAAYS